MNRTESFEKSAAMKRATNRQWVLKPQDLAVSFKLVTLKGGWLPYAELASVMRLSQFEAHAAVQRLMAARLVAEIEGPPQPVLASLRQFVIFGAPFAYPPVNGGNTIGFPTAHAASPMNEVMVAGSDQPSVWPHPEGITRGQGLLPLYPNLPLAAVDDPALYALLALFDALRNGQARERALARIFLEERLL